MTSKTESKAKARHKSVNSDVACSQKQSSATAHQTKTDAARPEERPEDRRRKPRSSDTNERETSHKKLLSRNKKLVAELKIAQDKLLHAQQDWERTFDSIPDMLAIIDNQHRIRRINKAMAQRLGLAPEQCVGLHCYEVVHGTKTPPFFCPHSHTVQDNLPHVQEVHESRINSDLLVSTAPLFDEQGRLTGSVHLAHDITERNKAESRTRHLASFPQLNPNPIIEVDFSGKIIFSNPAVQTVLRSLGLDADAVALFLPPDVQDILAELKNNKETALYREITIQNMMFGATIQLVPRFNAFRIYAYDITKRKQAEEALRESEQRISQKLNSILAPEGDVGKLDLADIINTREIQSLMDDFYKLVGIPMTITDLNGNVLVNVGWQDICARFHRIHPETGRQCMESDTLLTADIPSGKFRLYKCRNNMWNIATPIAVGGKRLGHLFTGQFFFADEPLPDYDFFRLQARQHGFDETEYITALDAVPRLSRQTVDTGMAFLLKLADIVSQLSYSNIKLARSLAERDALMSSLKSSEERLRLHTENSPLAIVEWDENFIVTRWAGDAESIFGWSAAEAIGKPIMNLNIVYEEDVPIVKQTMGKLTDGVSRRVVSTNRNYTKNGQIIYCEWYNSVLLNAEGKMSSVMSQVLDVTERRRAEEGLRESEERFRNMFERHRAVMLLVDPETGSVVEANSSAVEYYGYPREKLCTMHIQDINLLPVDEVSTERNKAAQEQKNHFIFQHRLADGNVRWVEVYSTPFKTRNRTLLFSIIHDISERKHAEAAIQHSLQRFELMSSTAGELLVALEPQKIVESLCRKVMDHLECHVFFNYLVDEHTDRLYLNAYAGIPAEEARRATWLDSGTAICGFVAQKSSPVVSEHITDSTDSRVALVRSYGITAYACHPLIGAGGKTIGTLSFGSRTKETFTKDDLSLMKAIADQVAVAITRVKDAQALRQQSDELLAVNNELEAFIYSVSHDLRAPLRTISGFVEILLEDYKDKFDPQGVSHLNRIFRGSEKMSRLIEDLLHLSRISRQQVVRTTIDLTAMAKTIFSELQEACPERRTEVLIAENLRTVADGRLTKLALTNLLQNAWKFTSKTQGARIEFNAFDQDKETVFFVKDNGAGFDPRFIDKMFLPFHRLHTEQEFEGTGIGLAIVERVIRRHGGSVWAEGEPGKGATIYFTLN